MTRPTNTHRPGFTLVEVLVAAGLSLLIMAVVTQAFMRGMDTLSQLKSVGEMQQRLRTFETVMRADLEADHFESRYGPKVSDQRLDTLAGGPLLTNETTPWRPPSKGFFAIRQQPIYLDPLNADNTNTNPNLTTWTEGTDSDNLPSTRATDHILHMTVRRNCTGGDKVFSTPLAPNALATVSSINMTQMNTSPGTFTSNWAEVLYFLDTTDNLGRTPGGVPLYGLYRRTRLLAASGGSASSAISWTTLSANDRIASQGMSVASDGSVNSPSTIRRPMARLGGMTGDRRISPNTIDRITRELDTNGATGSDLMLTDVISFEIKADWEATPGSNILLPGGWNANDDLRASYEYPFSDLPKVLPTRNPALAGQRVFDTWYDLPNTNAWLGTTDGATPQANPNDNAVPQPIRLRAIQIKVRVWDRKNNMARQVTLVQNL